MMLLAVDTTSAVATAALVRDGVLLIERKADDAKKHAETVLPMIDAMLEEAGVPLSAIDLFAVDIGPGSFTGVRIGVSLVNSLAFSTGKQIVPVDALQTLALSVGVTNTPVAALIDARNGNAYAALYQAGETLVAPCAVETEPFLSTVPEGARIVGDTQAENKTYPRARFVAEAALTKISKAQNEAEPLYLRPSQAERLKKSKSREA